MDDWFTALWGDQPQTQAEVATGLEAMRLAETARRAAVESAAVAKLASDRIARCGRCGGGGILSQFMHRNNGLCFHCGGSGRSAIHAAVEAGI